MYHTRPHTLARVRVYHVPAFYLSPTDLPRYWTPLAQTGGVSFFTLPWTTTSSISSAVPSIPSVTLASVGRSRIWFAPVARSPSRADRGCRSSIRNPRNYPARCGNCRNFPVASSEIAGDSQSFFSDRKSASRAAILARNRAFCAALNSSTNRSRTASIQRIFRFP